MNKSPDAYLEESLDREQLSEQDRKIRDLNDQFRQTFLGGEIYMTPGISSLALEVQARIFKAIQEFDGFDEDNDPYGTHEFGAVEVDNITVWFKLDAYDTDLHYGSPDPSDPALTTRVMTILLPNDY